MNKKLHTITCGLIAVFAVALLVLFTFTKSQQVYQVYVDDTGSTNLGVKAVVDANNEFAFDFYFELDKNELGNIFYSPYSLSAALAMVYEGADGKTADEIKTVFHFPDSNILRSNFAAIYNDLNNNNNEYVLNTANALWSQKDFPFLPDYLEIIEGYYAGEVSNLDFAYKGEESRKVINSYIEDQTNNKIKDLIPFGSLNKDTKLILTNAIYFKGTWVTQFNKEDTLDEDFTLISGKKIKTPMMKLYDVDGTYNYAWTDNLQILELPYNGDDISMLILLPKENNIALAEEYLTNQKISELKNTFNKQKVNIILPKFKFETKYFMVEELTNLGISTAFTDDADFSGMNGKHNLKIQDVIHQAFVEVDEDGAEAAAATAMSFGLIPTAATVPIVPTFRADHSFIFMIQENKTGNILFMGRVVDPTNEQPDSEFVKNIIEDTVEDTVANLQKVNDVLGESLEFMAKREIDEAEKLLKWVIQIEPDNARAHELLSEIVEDYEMTHYRSELIEFQQRVSISTDRYSYNKGGIIDISVKNNLKEVILYNDGGDRFFGIEYYQDDKWIDVSDEDFGGFQLTEKSTGDDCTIAMYERSEPVSLGVSSSVLTEFNRKICPFGLDGPTELKIVKYIDGGIYRLIFDYGYEISENDPYSLLEISTVYSRPFIIKN